MNWFKKFKREWKLDGYVFNGFNTKCPSCGSEIRFWGTSIPVSIESEQGFQIEGFLQLGHRCRNPFCKWSKVK